MIVSYLHKEETVVTTTSNQFTLQAIQDLCIDVNSRRAPISRKFTEAEAQHILDLVRSHDEITIAVEHWDGGDGEYFEVIGIRRKDGAVPRDKKVEYVYTAWIENCLNAFQWMFPNPVVSELCQALGGPKRR